MRIGIAGLGYVGLAFAAFFLKQNAKVVCYDSDSKKINSLNDGQLPIFEKGLSEVVKQARGSNQIEFLDDLSSVVKKTDILFVTIGTPVELDGSTNVAGLISLIKNIINYIDSDFTIVIKSTVPVGTCDNIDSIIDCELYELKKNHIRLNLIFSPEFLRQGEALFDVFNPSRIVVGVKTTDGFEVIKKIYSCFLERGVPILRTSFCNAELIKYVSNAALAMRISFVNEISLLCEKVDADIDIVSQGVGLDPRIGQNYLQAGLGYGGSCLPKDINALIYQAQQHHVNLRLIKAVELVNENQFNHFINKIVNHFQDLNGLKIVLWGGSFKGETDDIRNSFALKFIERFLDFDIQYSVYDPLSLSISNLKDYIKNKHLNSLKIDFSNDLYHSIDQADCIVVINALSEFKDLDYKMIKSKMKKAVIFDGRNTQDIQNIKESGIQYYSIGRKS